MPEWQPIETVPREEDGPWLLLYFPDIGVWPGFWLDEAWCVTDNKFEPCPIRGWNKPPTHWMPFPDAPKEAAIVLPPCDCGSMGCDSCFNL